MKNLFLLAFSFVLLFSACKKDTAENPKLDSEQRPTQLITNNDLVTPATYTGTVPCADCDGIEVSLKFKNDESVIVTKSYTKGGKSENNSYIGSYTVTGNDIEVNYDTFTERYKTISKNQIQQLNSNGSMPNGATGKDYILTKK